MTGPVHILYVVMTRHFLNDALYKTSSNVLFLLPFNCKYCKSYEQVANYCSEATPNINGHALK